MGGLPGSCSSSSWNRFSVSVGRPSSPTLEKCQKCRRYSFDLGRSDTGYFLSFVLSLSSLCVAKWMEVCIYSAAHKVHTYKEYHSVCPLVGIGTLPPPLSPASVPLPPERKGGGGGGEAHSRAGEGLGESQFQRLEEKLGTLPTLWRSISKLWHCF
jgi:hypothetical protein